ncbi:energy transducer TonB [Sphingomonas sp. BK580]|uniref:energy transducer TonB n=1 Tax=Sphingomonas sp. BK580 TaxID=2586972 RepID=UPI00160949DE|nr:energy transducer TonB [Sphingomonas sp. BK580]MBB3695036.1 TonB family protein [Sphingomonas sp. BK580]
MRQAERRSGRARGRAERRGATAARALAGAALLGSAPALAAAAPPDPAPLAPQGKWVVNYGERGCAMARAFGPSDSPVIVAWRSLPFSDRVELSVQRRLGQRGLRRGVLTIAVEGRGDETSYEAFNGTGDKRRTLRGWTSPALFADLPERAVLTLTPSSEPALAVSLVGTARALAALARCNDDIAKTWGIAPGEREAVATEAQLRGNPARFIGPEDYAKAAVARGELGTSAQLWTIDTDGRVSECRTVIPSGSEALDKAGCDAARLRARFTPATGRDGRPMTSHTTQVIKWELPGAWQDDPAYRAYVRQRREAARGEG